MDGKNEKQPAPIPVIQRTFLLRFWREPTQKEWRVVVQSVDGKQRLTFAKMPAVIAFFIEQLYSDDA